MIIIVILYQVVSKNIPDKVLRGNLNQIMGHIIDLSIGGNQGGRGKCPARSAHTLMKILCLMNATTKVSLGFD